jgi:transcription elongation factor
MVPILEMPDVLKVSKHTGKTMTGSWGRMKRGMYKGDLCQIDAVFDNEGKVKVQLVPRIDYNFHKTIPNNSDEVLTLNLFSTFIS